MRVNISAGRINFIAPCALNGALVIKRNLADNSEQEIAASRFDEAGSTDTDDYLAASFAIADFNALTHTLILRKDSADHDFSELLRKFWLDKKQMDSHYYVTVHLFGAGMARLEGDELLYQVMCYLEVMPATWQFYGGLITLAVFRISENLDHGAPLVEILLEKHRNLINAYHPVSDHSARWLISSSYNLAVICLYLEKTADTEILLDGLLQRASMSRTFPLTYMNYSQSMLLSGAIKFNSGKIQEAAHLFLECADFCSYALTTLFDLRNKFLLQHEMDCRVIMDVGYSAFKAAVLLTEQRFASDSKLADFKVEHERAERLDLSVIARRYQHQLGRTPRLLDQVALAIASMRKK